ncbi:MAG: hypothetical protein JXA66_05445, partial [Oligoflexia bacterium]|nr:hypothetical protein [Oligoflexia bacterium]
DAGANSGQLIRILNIRSRIFISYCGKCLFGDTPMFRISSGITAIATFNELCQVSVAIIIGKEQKDNTVKLVFLED